ESATPFMVLLAGFQAVLGRYSGQQDVAVGTPIAGRNRLETEDVIGFFVNTLVLRGDLSGEPSLRGLLGRVRESALSAHTHQEVPFEKLVEELAPERSLAHSPLFQVMFALQNASQESLEMEGLGLRSFGVPAAAAAKFDLTLGLEEWRGELRGAAEYAADLFDGTTIERLIGHLTCLLGQAVAAPEGPLCALPLLSEREREQIQVEWNDTGAPVPGACLHELFEAQAARTPAAAAV